MYNPFRWILSSIRRKAIFGLLVLLLSAVFLIGLSIVHQASRFIVAEVERRAASVARFVGTDLSAVLTSSPDISAMTDVMERICSDPSVMYATVISRDGEQLATACAKIDYQRTRSLPLSEFYDLSPERYRYHIYEDILEVYRRIDIEGANDHLFLLLGFDISDVQVIVAKITRLIAVNAFIVYIVGLLVLIVSVNRLAEPLENLTEGIKDVGRGDMPQPVPVHGYDEVASLSTAFNQMIEDLGRSKEEVEKYQKHLETMVEERTVALNRTNDELIEANRSLRAANQKLMELDKLKSNFLGIATHELKTPITVVEGYLDSLKDGFVGDLSDPQMNIVNETLVSCQRMRDLVSDMLDLTKIEAGKMPMERDDYPLINLVERVAGQMVPLIQKKRLTLDIREENLDQVAHIDEERITQVLINLISNAVKFTPEGGVITVSAALDSERRPPAITVSVSDTGIGISQEDIDHIFDEFAQIGPPGKEEGTGLGLAICRRIVDAHGGRIWAESAVGKGSTFTFSLPLGRVNVS